MTTVLLYVFSPYAYANGKWKWCEDVVCILMTKKISFKTAWARFRLVVVPLVTSPVQVLILLFAEHMCRPFLCCLMVTKTRRKINNFAEKHRVSERNFGFRTGKFRRTPTEWWNCRPERPGLSTTCRTSRDTAPWNPPGRWWRSNRRRSARRPCPARPRTPWTTSPRTSRRCIPWGEWVEVDITI